MRVPARRGRYRRPHALGWAPVSQGEAVNGGGASPDWRLLRLGAFAGIFVVGLYAGAFGPALKFFAADTGVSLDTAGFLTSALFIGSIVGSAMVASRLRRVNNRTLSLAGAAGIVGGTLGLGFAPNWPTLLAAGVLLGLGDGLLVAAGHSIAATTSSNVPHSISRLNQAFAVGAMLGPLATGLVLEATSERGYAYGCMAAVAVFAALVLLAAKPAPATHHVWPAGSVGHFSSTVNARLTLLMGAVLFLYVGAEVGLGAWLSSYTEEAAGTGVVAGAAVTSAYWGALLVGRLLSGAVFERGGSALRVLLVSVVAAGVGSVVIVVSGDLIVVAGVGAFVVGLAFGPVWPAAVALATEDGHPSVPALLVTVGNAGGIFLPWLQGRVLVSSGPELGIAMCTVLCVAMLALVLVSSRSASGARTILGAAQSD